MTQTVPGTADGPAADGGPDRPVRPSGSHPGGPGLGGLGLGGLVARAGWWYTAQPPRRLEVLQDTALGVLLAVFNLLSLLPYLSQLHPSWLAMLLVVGQCLPLALRRVSPLASLIGCGLIRNIYDGVGFGFAPLPLGPAIAFATIAERSGPVVRWLSVVGTVGGITWGQFQPGHTEPYDGVIQAFFFASAWTVGTLSRYRRAALDAASSRAAQAEAALAETASRAAAAERLRIARELHDVVAHYVSLVAVQAEAVGALLPGRPEAASASADLIGATARAAMTELRRLLGVLRFTANPEPAPAQLGPAPSLSRLNEVIDAAREAGLHSNLRGVRDPGADCRPGWTWPGTGSCRRPSPTRCGTHLALMPPSASAMPRTSCWSRSATPGRRPARPARPRLGSRGTGTAWPASPSGSRPVAARSPWGRPAAAALPFPPGCRGHERRPVDGPPGRS